MFHISICTTAEFLCRELSRCAITGEVFGSSIYFLLWATDRVIIYMENDTHGPLDCYQRRKDCQETVRKVVELTPIAEQFPFFMPFLSKYLDGHTESLGRYEINPSHAEGVK